MLWQYSPYAAPLLFSALVSTGLAVHIWRHRPTTGATSFAVLMFAVSFWSLCSALEAVSATLAGKLLWGNFQYLGIVCVPTAWLVFVLDYTDRRALLPRPYARLLAIEPLLTIALAWTDAEHGLIRNRAWLEYRDEVAILAVEMGTWFWVHAIYSYVLLLLGILLLFPVVFRSPFLYRRQSATVVVGALMPWLANALYIFSLSPWPDLDLTPFAFILMGGAVAWGLFRFQLLDVVPIARYAIVDGLQDPVLVLGPNERLLDLNPAALALVGQSLDRLVGTPQREALAALAPLADHLEQTGKSEIEIEVDGVLRAYELNSSDLYQRDTQWVGRLVVLHDISERKRAEEELVRAQRLRAAGELSLGVSHNLNNILTAILVPAQQLQDEIELGAAHAMRVQTILHATQRARDLVQRLSRSVEEAEEPLHAVSLNAIVEEAVRDARPRWKDQAEASGRPIVVETKLADVAPIAGNSSELYDVLINLIFNAVDAMPVGGAIHIETRRDGDRVLLKITDTGTGMDLSTQRRIFEPFFTTKADVGTGLGLATVYASVKNWGGDIVVESALGRGTTFLVSLLSWSGPSPEKESLDPDSAPVDEGPARVLIAEDEAIIAMMLVGVLEGAGHEVEQAENGQQALDLFVSDRYDIALLDLGMPQLPGDELARELSKRDPHIATVLLTGWRLGEGDPRRQAADFYLQKPIVAAQVKKVVAQALALRRARQAEL
jgi:PAS domain S-box-containing protein